MPKLASLSVEISPQGYVVTNCEYINPEKLKAILEDGECDYTDELYEAVKFILGELLVLQTKFSNKYDTVEL